MKVVVKKFASNQTISDDNLKKLWDLLVNAGNKVNHDEMVDQAWNEMFAPFNRSKIPTPNFNKVKSGVSFCSEDDNYSKIEKSIWKLIPKDGDDGQVITKYGDQLAIFKGKDYTFYRMCGEDGLNTWFGFMNKELK